MPVIINRKDVIFEPDNSRVIARFLYANEERSLNIISRVLSLSEEQQYNTLGLVLRKYSKRHRSISKILEKNFNKIAHLFGALNLQPDTLSLAQKLLIGAYFTMEYSIEAAAFFNPSIVEAPDQTELLPGNKRIILSFRATGEGHVSSIVFRSGTIDKNNNIVIEPAGKMLDAPAHIKNYNYNKELFLNKLNEMQQYDCKAYRVMEKKLTETFTYEELKRYVEETRTQIEIDADSQIFLREIMWLASSHYEMEFSFDTAISERVIFPIADTEKKGIEDARFVRFREDDGEVTYYATYTAYDGTSILPKVLLTKNFYQFKVLPVHGEIAQNKGMALFPRKIKGQYAMLCRIDGVNNYIAYSNNINVWRNAKIVQSPKFAWEFIQIGNCGSPIETPEGWLVVTHGVGPMREYVLGASLYDLENPEQEIGRLQTPLLGPNDKEREGYVPNVIYSCGSMIHNEDLIIPYALSDYASTYATVNLKELLKELKSSSV